MMNTCPVIFLNGPPRCGKDTLAKHIVRTVPGTRSVKFAAILKERTHALYGAPELPHDAFEDTKDIPCPLFLGLTPRQAYINISEKLMKPVHGPSVYGELLLTEMINERHEVKAFIISDSGFFNEASPILKRFGVDNCLLVRIHAEERGCTFDGDSRSYINLPCDTIDLNNNAGEVSFLYESKFKLDPILQSIVGGN